MRRIGFVVVGRVQGVAFRACTERCARRLGLVGFVRNRGDGAVEGEAEGAMAAVAEFATWLHEGSPWSRVEGVRVVDLALLGNEGAFIVER